MLTQHSFGLCWWPPGVSRAVSPVSAPISARKSSNCRRSISSMACRSSSSVGPQLSGGVGCLGPPPSLSSATLPLHCNGGTQGTVAACDSVESWCGGLAPASVVCVSMGLSMAAVTIPFTVLKACPSIGKKGTILARSLSTYRRRSAAVPPLCWGASAAPSWNATTSAGRAKLSVSNSSNRFSVSCTRSSNICLPLSLSAGHGGGSVPPGFQTHPFAFGMVWESGKPSSLPLSCLHSV